MNSRRNFLKYMAILGGTGFSLPLISRNIDNIPSKKKRISKPVKFGIISDIHRDLIPDADSRLEAFMKNVEIEKPDFIISLGDFCFGIPENQSFVKQFESASCPAYHVLGNHDMDRNTKDEMIGFLNIPSRYYSFDKNGYHFIILDANNLYKDGQYIDYEKANYFVNDSFREYIDDEQIEWLKKDLASTSLPVMIFSHQSLYHYSLGIKNRLEIQLIMEEENKKAGYRKIIACFNGHNHLDFYREINGIHYFDINSASYYWFEPASPGRYPDKSLYKKYPHLDNIALCKDPLYAFIDIDGKGNFSIKGIQSEWVPPVPDFPERVLGRRCSPSISDRKILI